MKKKDYTIHAVLLIFLLAVLFSSPACGQTLVVKKDSNGKYTNTISSDSTNTDKPVGVYKDNKGLEYLMYESKNNKVYIIRLSKRTGNKYKQYIKISK